MKNKEKYGVTVTFTGINNCSEIRPVPRKYTAKCLGAKGHDMCACVFSHFSRA